MQTLASSEGTHLLECFQQALAQNGNFMLCAPRQAVSTHDFASSVVKGLESNFRRLDSRFLYDARGSELFEAICKQPEYYQTRTEAEILKHCAPSIRSLTGPSRLLELGSGLSVKTEHLLSAYLDQDDQVCYIPIDVSEAALQQAEAAIAQRIPEVKFVGVNGTFEDALPIVDASSPATVVFLGSTIGNFGAEAEKAFWRQNAEALSEGDCFLLGVDLVKDPYVLDAAYNDVAGVTAEFTKNLFHRMNRELGSDLDVDAIEHVANYSLSRQCIEISARFTKAQTLRVEPLKKSFRIEAGEEIRTEVSQKYELETLIPRMESFGFKTLDVFIDEKRWFAVLLLQRRALP